MYLRAILVMAACGLGGMVVSPGRLAAQSPRPDRSVASADLAVSSFSDGDVAQMLQSLDTRLSRPTPTWDLRFTLWDFARVLQTRQMTTSQEARVLTHLGGIAAKRPSDAGVVERARHMVSDLTVGKIAPEIVGKDLDGADLRLSDYRGNVVAIFFSGDWCGACRGQYPYERQLLELYPHAPFAILGVDSSTTAARAREVKATERLPYRAWWDGGGAKSTDGPIATSWNVVGWPTVYVLDRDGVIRFVDVRYEELLKAVRMLLTEKPSTPARLF